MSYTLCRPRASTERKEPRSGAIGANRQAAGLVADTSVTDEVIPHFHNDLGVPVIEIGAKKFMCVGALPPQDHPHVYCDMGDAIEYVCPYCATLFRHNPALAPNEARRRNANSTTSSSDWIDRCRAGRSYVILLSSERT